MKFKRGAMTPDRSEKAGATRPGEEAPQQGKPSGAPQAAASPPETSLEGAPPPGTPPREDRGIPRDPEAVEAEIVRLRAREEELLRALAEMTNVQRRRKLETEQTVRYAQESLIRELLPVLDDFERALGAMPGTPHDPLHAGVELVRDRMTKILEKEGLAPIHPAGREFDPNLHDAIGAREAPPGVVPGTVLEVAQPGYTLHDRVLRHAKVIVAGPPSLAPTPPSMLGGDRSNPPDTIEPPLAEKDRPGA